MAKFIKLTSIDQTPYWVAVNHIETINYRMPSGSTVMLASFRGDEVSRCQETPEQILSLIEEAQKS